MELSNLIEQLELKITKMFASDKTGHDINHLKRTLNIALNIQKQEGGNEIVIGAAAILHDVHRLMSKEQGRFVHPKESLDKIRDILSDFKMDEKTLDHICHCIEHHEEYSFNEQGITVNDIEALIIQDADNIDAMGAIGISRVNMYCGHYGIPMWLPEIPFDRPTFEESKEDVSMIHHCYSKLLRLKDNMNTETGKKIAIHRHRFIEEYLKEFFAEWNGEK